MVSFLDAGYSPRERSSPIVTYMYAFQIIIIAKKNMKTAGIVGYLVSQLMTSSINFLPLCYGSWIFPISEIHPISISRHDIISSSRPVRAMLNSMGRMASFVAIHHGKSLLTMVNTAERREMQEELGSFLLTRQWDSLPSPVLVFSVCLLCSPCRPGSIDVFRLK
jgi:hypothetical protein